MSIKVLITGSNGQLGKTIKELYAINGDEIVFTFTTKAELDISVKSEIEDFFSINGFNYCINCAAYTNVEQAGKDRKIAFKVNAEGVKHLAQICKKTKTVLIHISTDYVFDGNKNTPYLESDITNPINEYGKSKLLGEQYVQDITQNHFIIRTSWLYSKYGNNFVKNIVNKIQENTEIKIITSQKGTPTSCIDLTKFIYFLIKSKVTNYGIFHFSAIGETTWYDFAIHISNHFSYNVRPLIIPTKKTLFKTRRPMYSTLSNYKRQQIFPIEFYWQNSVNEVVKSLVGKT